MPMNSRRDANLKDTELTKSETVGNLSEWNSDGESRGVENSASGNSFSEKDAAEKEREIQFFLSSAADQLTVCGFLLLAFLLLLVSFIPWGGKTKLEIEKGALPIQESFASAKVHGSYLVDVNAAGVHELCILPGVGEITARKIIAERETNGPYQSLEDLQRVNGIGAKKIQTLAPYVAPIAGSNVLVEQPSPEMMKPSA